MNQEIGLLSATVIKQNTNVALSALPTFNYDYRIYVSLSDLGSLNNLFLTRAYVQNLNDPNQYTIDLTLNKDFIISRLTSPNSGIPDANIGRLTTGMDPSTSLSIGQRLLEIMAIKIFGSALARVGILNDTEFTNSVLINALVNGFSSSVTNDKNLIFGQYSANGRINAVKENDKNKDKDKDSKFDPNPTFSFNFQNLSMSFPVYLTGSIIPNTATTIINNGASGVGGAGIVDGSYNIPVQIVFTSS
jgi:hypothetical protein